MQTETNDPPKIAYSIKEACKASSSWFWLSRETTT